MEVKDVGLRQIQERVTPTIVLLIVMVNGNGREIVVVHIVNKNIK